VLLSDGISEVEMIMLLTRRRLFDNVVWHVIPIC
jgi:hypothetical protein